MKKTIILMRHGKAADGFEYKDDFERPLELRGRIEVEEAAKKLKTEGIIPDVILASPAFRTSITARIVAEVFGIQAIDIDYQSSLYMSHESHYLNAMNSHENKTVMIVGHNPFVGEFALQFSGYKIHGFPTSSIAAFEFDSIPISGNSKCKTLYLGIRK